MTCTNLDGEKWQAVQATAHKRKPYVMAHTGDWRVSYFDLLGEMHLRWFPTWLEAIDFAHASWYL